jgi:hypothetical protein
MPWKDIKTTNKYLKRYYLHGLPTHVMRYDDQIVSAVIDRERRFDRSKIYDYRNNLLQYFDKSSAISQET